MKIRYHNRVSGEVRDVSLGSAEETTVKMAVFTENGESLPLWVLSDEYERLKSLPPNMTTAKAVFGNRSRRLTPGEIAMGIDSYEQKVLENTPGYVKEIDEEEDLSQASIPDDADDSLLVDNPDDEDDEEDDEDDSEKVAAASTPTRKRAPRRAPRRTARSN